MAAPLDSLTGNLARESVAVAGSTNVASCHRACGTPRTVVQLGRVSQSPLTRTRVQRSWERVTALHGEYRIDDHPLFNPVSRGGGRDGKVSQCP